MNALPIKARQGIILAITVIAMVLYAPSYSHASIQNSGQFECNAKAVWTLSDSGILRIEGHGKTGVDSALYELSDKVLSVSVGKDITSIGFETFCYFTNLRTVTFDKGSQLTSIEGYAFNNCQSLASITIPAKVTSIGNSAFAGCFKLSNAKTESGALLTTVGASAFSNCESLKNAVIGNSIKTVGDYAFSGCRSITSVTIPKSATSIGKGAFSNCSKLSKVTVLNQSKTKIASTAFSGTKVKSVAKSKRISIKSIRKAGKGKLKVTWNKVAGAKKYVIYYKKSGSSKYKHVTVKGSKKSVVLKKLKRGKHYIICVKAKGKTKTICKSKKKKSCKVR